MGNATNQQQKDASGNSGTGATAPPQGGQAPPGGQTVLHHQIGQLQAIPLGARSIIVTRQEMAKHDARVRKMCAENGLDPEVFQQFILQACVNWRAYSAAMQQAITDNPGIHVVICFGQRWIERQEPGESLEQYVDRCDGIRAVAQVCDHADRIGSPVTIITTGGVNMTEMIAGEVNAERLTLLLKTALGPNGASKVRFVQDTISLNTGDQGNFIGNAIATILAQTHNRKVLFVPVLPAVHIARFAATILAGIVKTLSSVFQGREKGFKDTEGNPIIQDGKVNLHGLATRLLLGWSSTHDMDTRMEDRKMTMGDEAFGPREPAGQAALPSKTLGAEYVERLGPETNVEKNKAYACPALRPEHVILFVPESFRKDYKTIHDKAIQELAAAAA